MVASPTHINRSMGSGADNALLHTQDTVVSFKPIIQQSSKKDKRASPSSPISAWVDWPRSAGTPRAAYGVVPCQGGVAGGRESEIDVGGQGPPRMGVGNWQQTPRD